jgi:hypothetical protein
MIQAPLQINSCFQKVDGMIVFQCSECKFNRKHSTIAGAIDTASKHLKSKHNIRLVLR